MAFGSLPPAAGSDVERLDTVLNGVMRKVDGGSLVIIEDFAFARGTRAHQLGGLGFMVRHALWKNFIPFIIVGPKQRVRFCTGNGNGTKELMLKYVEKRFGVDTDDHNAADAVALNFIGQSLLGWYKPELDFQVQILQAIRDSYSGGAKSKVKKSRKVAEEVLVTALSAADQNLEDAGSGPPSRLALAKAR